MKSGITYFLLLSPAELFTFFYLYHICGLWIRDHHRGFLFISNGADIFSLILLDIGISILILFPSHLFHLVRIVSLRYVIYLNYTLN